ncbi:MAG: D-alanine--D-alanine ligase [Planctomycetes bacterium]|nr:D-alanine--D-alanine ligase [Planctomycetota bacterium]
MPQPKKLKVLVLAGGPDRERPVSLQSGATVTNALAQAGHDVRQRDITPDNLAALDEFTQWAGHLVFPMLHGAWGEGGGLQKILAERKLPHVGCRADAAELCMDKHRTKLVLIEHGLPTPPSELLIAGQRATFGPPVVVKPPCEGSSIDLTICRDDESLRRTRSRLRRRHARLLVERFVEGMELTVGLVGSEDGKTMDALPPIHIIPATEFYDYNAKYDRDDTQYLFDIKLPKAALAEVMRVSVEAARVLGCRHMCRVDIIVDREKRPWILEVNTIPGFTSHSLLPKAAARAGITLPKLVDRLARLALA